MFYLFLKKKKIFVTKPPFFIPFKIKIFLENVFSIVFHQKCILRNEKHHLINFIIDFNPLWTNVFKEVNERMLKITKKRPLPNSQKLVLSL